MFIYRQKINLILHIFLDIPNLLFRVLGACLTTHTQSDPTNLQKTFVLICRQKISFFPRVFLVILPRYTNLLLWVLGPCLAAQTQNDIINLQKTSIFIRIPKINFIVHFFLEILYFKKSCNLIGRQHFGSQFENQNFARYGTGVKFQ